VNENEKKGVGVGRTADKEVICTEEESELMAVGASIVTDISKLLRATSSKIRTDFTYGVVPDLEGAGTETALPAQIGLLFTITDLGASREEDVEKFINEHLLDMLHGPSMIKYKVQWAFEVEEGEKNGR
jgi:hypothetical protein